MKKISFIILLFLFTSLFGQSKKYQVGVGVNQSWFDYEVDLLNETETDFRPKINFVLNYNFLEYEDIKATFGIRYYHLGRSITVDYLNAKTETVSMNHYFISIPIQGKYKLNFINTDIIINAETSYMLVSNSKAPSPYNSIITERNTIDEMKRFQFSVGGGLEYNFQIGTESFGIRSMLNFTLTNIPKQETFVDESGSEFSWVNYKAMEVNILASYYF